MKALILLSIVLSMYMGQNCPNDKLCNACDKNTCIGCFGGYTDDNGRCALVDKPIEHCRTYSSADRCETCRFGYYLTNNTCLKIPVPNCIMADDDPSKCIMCGDGIIAENGRCDGDKRCDIENCYGCFWPTICSFCKEGYSNAATKCVTEPKNCVELDFSDLTKCTICYEGYYKYVSFFMFACMFMVVPEMLKLIWPYVESQLSSKYFSTNYHY